MRFSASSAPVAAHHEDRQAVDRDAQLLAHANVARMVDAAQADVQRALVRQQAPDLDADRHRMKSRFAVPVRPPQARLLDRQRRDLRRRERHLRRRARRGNRDVVAERRAVADRADERRDEIGARAIVQFEIEPQLGARQVGGQRVCDVDRRDAHRAGREPGHRLPDAGSRSGIVGSQSQPAEQKNVGPFFSVTPVGPPLRPPRVTPLW